MTGALTKAGISPVYAITQSSLLLLFCSFSIKRCELHGRWGLWGSGFYIGLVLLWSLSGIFNEALLQSFKLHTTFLKTQYEINGSVIKHTFPGPRRLAPVCVCVLT